MERIFILGTQSSGASYVAYCLAQREHIVAIIDLFSHQKVPKIECAGAHILLKCTITTTFNWWQQMADFEPTKTILVTRNIEEIKNSLKYKIHQDHDGKLTDKLAIYQDILNHDLEDFDEIISYERFKSLPHNFVRSQYDILNYNNFCEWARVNYLKKWGFGRLHFDKKGFPAQKWKMDI